MAMLKPPHVLVVEDDPQFRRLTVRMLKRAGYTVSEADGFELALNLVSSDPSIEVVVTDIGMPAGTPHGMSIAKMIRSRRTQVKVVYMTGGDAEKMTQHADGAAVLQKPFDSEALTTAVRNAIGSR
ncbi:MAG: response regulator [Reyranella sp.]|nr:response regulator [Reyranella sp.]